MCHRNIATGTYNLEHLDVRGNNLKSIAIDGLAKGVQYLNVTNNPIISLELQSTSSFPSLEILELGSDDLQYVGFDIIRRIHENSKNRDVRTTKGGSFILSEDSRNFLFPPKDVLKEGSLQHFLTFPYEYLSRVKSAERKSDDLAFTKLQRKIPRI